METNQYHLRALEMQDLDVLFALENDPAIWKYTNRQHPYTKAFLMEYVMQSHLSLAEIGQLRLAIVDAQDRVLGLVDLFDADLHHQRAAVGIAILRGKQNMGLGKQALKLLIDYCQSHLSLYQLYCEIDINNHSSKRLFESAGFVLCGTKKDWNYYDQAFHDVHFYQKIIAS